MTNKQNKLLLLLLLLLQGCGIGSYLFETECRRCPIGSFSDIDAATNCTQCPDGETTFQEGSTSCRSSTICKNHQTVMFQNLMTLHCVTNKQNGFIL